MARSAQRTVATSQSWILLFENTIQYTLNLCPADSEIAQLMYALDEVRFHGANRTDIRNSLSSDVIIAFDPIADQIMHAYEAYIRMCEEDRPDNTDDPIPLGGMAVKPSSLKIMSMVAEGTDAEYIFNALYEVCFNGVTLDEAEAELPKRAKMVFTALRDLMGLGSAEPKLSRSEINRINANKRWEKKRAAEAAARQSEVIDPPVRNETTDVPREDESNLSAPRVIHNVPAVSENSDADVDNSPDAAANANGCESDANSPNDASDASFLNISINKSKKNKNNSSHTSRACEEAENSLLWTSFDKLWDLYPKKEGIDKARAVYKGLVGPIPDETIIAEIQEGLNTALAEDRRFFGEYRFIPQMSNWLRDGGWKAANVIHLQDPDGLYIQREPTNSEGGCFSSSFNALASVYGYEAAMAEVKRAKEQIAHNRAEYEKKRQRFSDTVL